MNIILIILFIYILFYIRYKNHVSHVTHLQFSIFNIQFSILKSEAKRFSNEVFPGEFAARSGEGVAPMD